MLQKRIYSYVFGGAMATLLLTGCADNKLTLTGQRQVIDIASIDDVRASDSKLVGGGYSLTQPVTNQEWRSASGGNDRRPPHARGGEQNKIAFYIKIGAGTGKSALYPARDKDGDEKPETPRGEANIVNIAPIVADNKIFAIDSRYQITVLDWQKDSDQPKVKWRYLLSEANNYLAATGGGMAFANAGGPDGKTPLLVVTTGFGKVYGFNANTGDVVFQQNLISPIKNAAAITDSLAIVKTIDGSVYGLSLRDGRRVWQNNSLLADGGTIDAIGFKGGSAPTASAGRVWTGFLSGNVMALNGASGNILWQDGTMKFSIGDSNRYREIIGNMMLDGGVIYAFSFGSDAIAFRADGGGKLWRKRLATIENPTMNNQTIFIIDSDYNLKAINKATGNLFWSRILEKYQYPGTRTLTLVDWHGPLLVSKRLFLANNIGQYMFVNALNGNMIEQGQDDIYKLDSPAIAAKNTILFVNSMGYLVGIQ